jgi:hypothetical protein
MQDSEVNSKTSDSQSTALLQRSTYNLSIQVHDTITNIRNVHQFLYSISSVR